MNQIFLGRTQEIDNFTQVLDKLVNLEVADQEYIKPYIFLLYGTGGIGKTTLLQHLKNIAETRLQDNLNTIFLDWEKERDRFPDLQVGHDYIQPTTVLKVIYNLLNQQAKDNFFPEYLNTKELWEQSKKKINEALESQLENEIARELRPLGADGIAELLRENKNKEEEEFDLALDFVQSHLNPEQLNIYQDPETNLAQALGSGISNLSQEKPLIIFFDTYEIVDKPECDYILREAIKYSIGSIVWVIAGRANLADSGWRNPQAKNALLTALHEEEQDADVIAIAIKLLENFDNAVAEEELVNFLDHQDRFVRRAAARELGKLVKYETDREKVLNLAVEPLIKVMRNNPISNVRDTALEALISIYETIAFLEPQPNKLIKIQRALWREKDKENFPEWIKEKLRNDRGEQQHNLDNIKNLLELLPKLQDSQVDVRERTIELIIEKSKTEEQIIVQQAMEELVSLLNQPDEDPDVRVASVEAVGEIGYSSETVIHALIDALNFDKESDRYLRQKAAEVLGKLTATINSSSTDSFLDKIIDALNKAVREDVISTVRNTAEKSLNNIMSQTGSELAKRYFQRINREPLETLKINDVNEIINIFKTSSDIDQRIQAVQALSKINQTESINTLKQALNEPEPDICAAAADALGNINNPSALKPLLAKVQDKNKPEFYKDRIAREAVVRAIGELNLTLEQLDEEQVVEILIDLWRNDAISNVRDAVEFSMQKIYTRNQHPKAYKALKRYPDYENYNQQSKYGNLNTKEYYYKFF